MADSSCQGQHPVALPEMRIPQGTPLLPTDGHFTAFFLHFFMSNTSLPFAKSIFLPCAIIVFENAQCPILKNVGSLLQHQELLPSASAPFHGGFLFCSTYRNKAVILNLRVAVPFTGVS